MEDLIIEYYNMAIYGEYGNVTIKISNNVTIWFTRFFSGVVYLEKCKYKPVDLGEMFRRVPV